MLFRTCQESLTLKVRGKYIATPLLTSPMLLRVSSPPFLSHSSGLGLGVSKLCEQPSAPLGSAPRGPGLFLETLSRYPGQRLWLEKTTFPSNRLCPSCLPRENQNDYNSWKCFRSLSLRVGRPSGAAGGGASEALLDESAAPSDGILSLQFQ